MEVEEDGVGYSSLEVVNNHAGPSGRDVQCCRVLSQYHLNIHSNSDTRDVHVQSMYMGLAYTHIHHMTDHVTE